MLPQERTQHEQHELDAQETPSEQQEQQKQQRQQELLQRTPQRSRVSTPQSAPPKPQTSLLLTSPEAARRSKESLEAIKVARTLKEGFSRLKARVDPRAQNHILSPLSRRALRTYSANGGSLTSPLSSSRRLSSSHSSLSRSGSAGSAAPSEPNGLLLSPPTFKSPRARPTSLHQAYSCPQRRFVGDEPSTASRLPAPKFSLAALRSDSSEGEEPTKPRAISAKNASKSSNTEVAEAAAAMMLFMKSESSSQHGASPPPPPLPMQSSAPESPTSLNPVLDSDRAKSPETDPPEAYQAATEKTSNDTASKPAISAATGSPAKDGGPASQKRARAAPEETLGATSPQKRPCVS